MMKDVDRCKEILDSLQKSMRYWGKSVAEFVELFKGLTPEERQILSDTAPKKLKFGFMSQITQTVCHCFDEYDRARKLELLEQAYVLILFENFEFDYRESLLKTRAFYAHAAAHPELNKEAWGKAAYLQRENAKKYMG